MPSATAASRSATRPPRKPDRKGVLDTLACFVGVAGIISELLSSSGIAIKLFGNHTLEAKYSSVQVAALRAHGHLSVRSPAMSVFALIFMKLSIVMPIFNEAETIEEI